MERANMNPSVKELAGDKYILWGASWSLYTAKVRPYLIKKGIDYVEINPSHPHYIDSIMEKVGYFTVPVLETPDGEVIADSMEIMEYLELKYPDLPMLPADKPLAALAHLIHSFGSEGLTKSAMYLRWNTSFDNRMFARNEFDRTLATPEMANGFSEAMRAYLPILGVTLDHDVDVAIEKSIDQLYQALNEHFLKYPYILGGVPSLADYGLMGPLYAHHGRDPASNNAIKEQAPALFRWIETMQRSPVLDPEVWQVPQEYFSIDDLPDTLVNFLKLIGENFVPEIRGSIGLYHEWLDAQDHETGTVVDVEGQKRCHQVLGQLEHTQMGAAIQRIALLDDVSHHLRFQSLVEEMNATEKKTLTGILQSIGAEDLIDLKLKRAMKRENYAYVLT
jgi:glutathione S-transferase